LPHYCFTTIAQTPDGYLWLGSFANLARFDGTQFAVFDRENTPQLPGRIVRKLFVDRAGALWIAMDVGLAQYQNGQWRSFSTNQGVVGGMVDSFAEDRQGNLFA